MMAGKGFTNKISAALLAGVFVIALGTGANAAQVHRFANGITATVHSAAEIQADPSVAGIDLATADRPWFPYPEHQVVDALNAVSGFATSCDVEVYILPAPPAQVGGSYASRSAIYLSPGTGVVDASTVAYITTHELGHVLTWAFLDEYSVRWGEYLALRGLDAALNGPAAAHAERAREIIAEDIRYLFGGPLATLSGSIENRDLALPDRVSGLKELLAGFLSGRPATAVSVHSTAFPNPCNPRTTVVLRLPAGASVSAEQAQLRIFDVRGALVRTLVGGQLSNDQVRIQWNGDSDQGTAVASGHYLYVVRAGNLQAKGSISLVR